MEAILDLWPLLFSRFIVLILLLLSLLLLYLLLFLLFCFCCFCFCCFCCFCALIPSIIRVPGSRVLHFDPRLDDAPKYGKCLQGQNWRYSLTSSKDISGISWPKMLCVTADGAVGGGGVVLSVVFGAGSLTAASSSSAVPLVMAPDVS